MAHVSIIAFFCEDIRQEKNDTNTLIGILPDNIAVATFPCAFPKLGLYVRAHIDLDLKSKVTDIILKLRLPDGTEQELNKVPEDDILREMANVKGGGTYVGFIMATVAVNFAVPVAGLIQVVAQFAGDEYVCGRMNVQLPDTSQADTEKNLKTDP